MNSKNNDEAGFKYNPADKPEDQQSIVETTEKADEPLFNWSSPDSFSDRKSPFWYLSLIIITAVISAVIYLLTRDTLTTIVIVVSGLLLGLYAAKKPKTVNYQLTKHGFTVNGRYYAFGSYRSFAIVHHGDGRSAVLTPLKRFMPYMYIYFDTKMEDQVTSALTDVLPKESVHRDVIDKALRRIGF